MRLTTQSLKKQLSVQSHHDSAKSANTKQPLLPKRAGLACGCSIYLCVSALQFLDSGTVVATGAVLAIIAHNVKLAGVLAR